MKSESEVAQLCPTLCDPVDCNLPGSSVHGILQAIVLEWAAIFFSRGSSQPRDWTQVSHLAGRHFNLWASREALVMLTVWISVSPNEITYFIGLFFGRKAMTNLDSILKSQHITLLTKVRKIKARVFPVVMYGCESQTIKKVEHQRIDTFELWCCRTL